MNKHGIAEAKETIFFLHRNFVSMKDLFPRRHGADQHEQRRFRQMEICNQSVDDVERKARINEDICPAGAALEDACRAGASL